jgi:hypothetical protein
MNSDLRSLAWQTVENVFADLHIAIGTPFPIAVMVEVKKEGAISNVRSELAAAGLEIAGIDGKGWLFRRWQIAAKSKPQPIARAAVEHWLDSLESRLRGYDAKVLTWVPLVPNA